MAACERWIQGSGGTYRLEQRQRLEAPREEVFAYFADPYNLEETTPDRLAVEVETVDPTEIGLDACIRYRLKFHGLPLGWTSRVTRWEPPELFTDSQEEGPYARWVHEHRFLGTGEETLAIDRVRYRPPAGLLGRLAHSLHLKRDLEAIFEHRADKLADRFGEPEVAEELDFRKL